MNNQPITILSTLIKQYGHDLLNDPRRVENLLKDLCPQNKREIHVLVAALKERIPQDLLASQALPSVSVVARLMKKLHEDLAMAEDAARWGVESWGEVLGVDVTVQKVPEIVPVRIKLDEKQVVERKSKVSNLVYTDPMTGLKWVRNGNIAGKTKTWNEAIDWVKKLDYAGYSDWRLPTKEELEAFAKLGSERPVAEWFNANGFNNTVESYYWSSSTNASYPYSAWVVDFDYGYVSNYDKGSSYYVWPVRG